jgi:hypothetical protein
LSIGSTAVTKAGPKRLLGDTLIENIGKRQMEDFLLAGARLPHDSFSLAANRPLG